MSMDRHSDARITLPNVAVRRGGITYPQPLDAVAQMVADQQRVVVNRIVDKCVRIREHTIRAAVAYASVNGMDVRITEPPRPQWLHSAPMSEINRLRYVGIEFTPAQYLMPVMFYDEPYADAYAAEMAWEAADVEHWLTQP